jgi:hypothetical protein
MAKRSGRARKPTNLVADLEKIISVCEKRTTAVVRMSVQDVINDAQTPTGKGGRMRVDTGFLRASGQASLTGMPTGPSRGELKEKHAYDDGNRPPDPSVELSVNTMQPGDKLYFGWTANYAKYRELYDGFLEGAVMNWPDYVAKNTREMVRLMTVKSANTYQGGSE